MRDFLLFPEGDTYGLFAADRIRLLDRFVVEAGLRWDRQTYIDGDQVSPRVSALWEVGRRTNLRASWGLYSQAQHLNELQVTDGVTDLFPCPTGGAPAAQLRARVARATSPCASSCTRSCSPT